MLKSAPRMLVTADVLLLSVLFGCTMGVGRDIV
jgi:hypothetical protein